MRKYINLRTGTGVVNGMFGEMEFATATHEFGYRCMFYLISLTPAREVFKIQWRGGEYRIYFKTVLFKEMEPFKTKLFTLILYKFKWEKAVTYYTILNGISEMYSCCKTCLN